MKKEKIVFWNVDTQYDFMRDDKSFKGALPIKGARKIEGNLRRLTSFAVSEGIPIISTADWHTPESKEFSDSPDFKTTFPPHCLQGTKGARFVPATNCFVDSSIYGVDDWHDKEANFRAISTAQHIVIYKDDFDVFKGNPYVDKILKVIKPTLAVVYGVATNVCVNYAILGLRRWWIPVIAVIDAMKELPGCDKLDIFNNWDDMGGVQLVDTTKAIMIAENITGEK